MLRITWLGSPTIHSLKLEGELIEPWVSAVKTECAQKKTRADSLKLDLAGIRFVDTAGAWLLRDLMIQGTTISACSSFVSELLRLSGPRSAGSPAAHDGPGATSGIERKGAHPPSPLEE